MVAVIHAHCTTMGANPDDSSRPGSVSLCLLDANRLCYMEGTKLAVHHSEVANWTSGKFPSLFLARPHGASALCTRRTMNKAPAATGLSPERNTGTDALQRVWAVMGCPPGARHCHLHDIYKSSQRALKWKAGLIPCIWEGERICPKSLGYLSPRVNEQKIIITGG